MNRDPFILPFVHTIKLAVRRPMCGNYDIDNCVTQEEFEAELAKVLAAVRHVETLALDWQNSRKHPYPSLRQIWPVLGAQLRSLKIRADAVYLQDLLSLGASTTNLQVLSLTIILRDGDANGPSSLLRGLVPTLINPSRSSLTRLGLEFIYTPVRRGDVAMQSLGPHVRDFFEVLSQTYLITLRHLAVLLPFQGASTHSEEDPLLRFLSAHALHDISINYKSTTWRRFHDHPQAGAGYFRLFRLASEIPHFTINLRRLSLHVPSIDESSGDDLLPPILDMLPTINSPLEDFLLSGRPLAVDEVGQVVHALSRQAGSLRQLKLNMLIILPSTFDLLSGTLPSLYLLDITAEIISSDEGPMDIPEQEFGAHRDTMIINVRVFAVPQHECAELTIIQHRKYPKLNVFTTAMRGRNYGAWGLHRLLLTLFRGVLSLVETDVSREMCQEILYKAIPSLSEIVLKDVD
jgi:hypothetical protein